ncbi:MAG: hypothetical protein U9R48_03055 [Chloroflexota bacterium]|nr:hypothetical protein [Chloroflexota bacterium]
MTAYSGDGKSLPDSIEGRIAVVGVCASGKTVLVEKLRALGYDAHACAQEHSYVPPMWRLLVRPQILVYLEASLETVRQRGRVYFDAAYLQEQHRRLRHARMHCDIYVNTDNLDEDGVLRVVASALEGRFHLVA